MTAPFFLLSLFCEGLYITQNWAGSELCCHSCPLCHMGFSLSSGSLLPGGGLVCQWLCAQCLHCTWLWVFLLYYIPERIFLLHLFQMYSSFVFSSGWQVGIRECGVLCRVIKCFSFRQAVRPLVSGVWPLPVLLVPCCGLDWEYPPSPPSEPELTSSSCSLFSAAMGFYQCPKMTVLLPFLLWLMLLFPMGVSGYWSEGKFSCVISF